MSTPQDPQLPPLADAIVSGPLLLDGAMGSLLYERGVLHTRSYDELNLSAPELIRSVHDDYVAAGANLIETNTFGSNRVALARHGLAEQAVAINRAAVQLARAAAGAKAYVAGAVGPTGVKFGIATSAERRLARFALAEQIDTLVLAGVDAIVLETFGSILEMETALDVAKERGPRVPVFAMMVFDAAGRSDGGLGPAEIADRLIAAGADVVGANCGVGPAELYQVSTSMVGRGKPVIAQPNAGLPATVEGRTIYVANPEHFGVFARRMLKSGVRLVGGCCGTTPAHIRAMLGAVRMLRGEQLDERITHTRSTSLGVNIAYEPRVAKTPLRERSRLGARIARGEFAVSVELTSPPGADLSKTAQQVAALAIGGVDIVNIADGPRASARMANVAVCARLVRETAVEPILHVCARDRSFLGLIAHLYGAHALGLRDLVLITGDPPKMGDYPFSTPVYDVDSIGLLRIAAGMNAGVDPAGKECEPTAFVLATGAEPGAADRDRELRRLEDKKAAGAELVMTQPVYDPRTLERFLDDCAPLGLPVMVGILPLASHRNAEFLNAEVPGMSIPAEYRERMAKVSGGAAAGRAEGIRIAQEALAAVCARVAGAYVMPPFNRVESALAVLEVAKPRWAARVNSSLSFDEAQAFHRGICVMDLHADTAKLMDKLGYDLAIRHERVLPRMFNAFGHVDLPRLREGGVAGQFFSFWTIPKPERGCHRGVMTQLDAMDRAIEVSPAEIVWTRTGADVRAAKAAGKIAALGGIEGGQALESRLDTIEEFSRRGVRYLGLLHLSDNSLGRPTYGRNSDRDTGLTAFGRDAVRECERCGVIVDLAHVNRRGFFDAIELATLPPIVSHAGVRGVHDHARNLDDEQVRAIADRGGCVGVIFAKKFLGGASIEAVVDHIVHVIDIAGEDVPALGSDFDGAVVPPDGLEDVAQLPNLTIALAARGIAPRVLEKILGGNVLRVLDAVPAWGQLR